MNVPLLQIDTHGFSIHQRLLVLESCVFLSLGLSLCGFKSVSSRVFLNAVLFMFPSILMQHYLVPCFVPMLCT